MLFLVLLEHTALFDLSLGPFYLLFVHLLSVVIVLLRGLLLHRHVFSICISCLVFDFFLAIVFVVFVLHVVGGKSALDLLGLVIEDILRCTLIVLHVLVRLLLRQVLLVRFRHLRLLDLLFVSVFFDLISLLILLLLLLLLLLPLLELLAELEEQVGA